MGDYFNAKFVCLKLNAEKEGRELAKRFKVTAYPTFIVVDTDEKVRAELKGAMDADKFLTKLDEALNPNYAPDKLAARYADGERTPDLVNRYALYLMEQRKEAEGFKVVNDYYASLTEVQRLESQNSFLFTRYTLDLRMRKLASWWIIGTGLMLRCVKRFMIKLNICIIRTRTLFFRLYVSRGGIQRGRLPGFET